MSKKKINVAIVGATGFTGLDLIFLLYKHPNFKINCLCATKNLNKDITFFDKRIKEITKNFIDKKLNWNKTT